jgi:DNA mismatch repair ATPase MutS
LAGLPKEILDRAKGILSHLERPNGAADAPVQVKKSRKRPTSRQVAKPQMDLF